MKIICPNCRKKYNYEKHMGICPSCTKYTSYTEVQKQSTGLAPSAVEQKSSYTSPQDTIHNINSPDYHGDFEDYEEYTHESAHVYSSPDTSYQTSYPDSQPNNYNGYNSSSSNFNPVKAKPSFIANIMAVIIAIAIISVFILVVFYMIPNKVAELKEFQEPLGMDRESYNVGETVNFTDGDFTAEISKVLDSERYSAPEGWKYVCIPFTYIKEQSGDYVYSPNKNYFDVFLKINDYYVGPVTEFDLPDMDYADEKIKSEFEELNPSYSVNYYAKNLVFLIPVDVTEYDLSLYEYEENEEFYASKLIRIVDFHFEESLEAFEDLEATDSERK